MALTRPLLGELAAAFAISTEFWDWKGRLTEVDDATVVGVLAGMGIDARTDETARTALAEHELRQWRRQLPACTVVDEGEAVRLDVHVGAGWPATVWVHLEEGGRRDARQLPNGRPDREVDGRLVGEATFELDALPIGYHQVYLETPFSWAEAPLIVVPVFVGFPAAMGDRREWGFATQLYSVRSARSWGMGDLADLADLAIWSGIRHGAGYILVNPLHAAEPICPIEPSPYLPSSRRYLNPLYIRPESIPEYATMATEPRERIRALREELHSALYGTERIDRDASWSAKVQALRLIHTEGLSPAREMAKDSFVRRAGRSLHDFAAWCVLAQIHGLDWRQWPTELKDPKSGAVAALVADHARDADFFIWLQWIADQQLHAAQAAARDAGMRIGIVNDLAVGVSQASADAWIHGDAFASGVSVGAPPDQYNQLGQDWGQAPWRPDRLEELGYAPFRALVAGILRHSGGVRVDHIMGLFRLWWIPDGLGPARGAYVRYDHRAMVGVLALEARRAGALVVGEDLGTVEPWVRDYLRERGLLGTSVAWFEATDGGLPLPPEQYREYCMASVTTHDMPPTAGYLAGDHIRLQHSLGLLTEDLADELGGAERRLETWRRMLSDGGFLQPDETDTFEQVLALHKYLAASRARVLCAALTDAVADRRTQNQPGTSREYPNWCIPLSGPDGRPLMLEEVFDSEHAARLAAVMTWPPHRASR